MAAGFLRKNVLVFALALSATMTLVIGGTIAWLSAQTSTVDNHLHLLTASGKNPDMKASLDEPGWERENAVKAVPGQDISKDPAITNTSVNALVSEWAGIKITFTYGGGADKGKPLSDKDYTRLMGIITIKSGTGDGYDTGWEEAAGQAGSISTSYFYYKTLLAQTESTSPLFTSVAISSNADSADIAFINNTLGGFQIDVSGGTLQGNISDTYNSDVKSELYALIR